MLEPMDNGVLWIIVLGFIIAFFLAFGVGANDVANSFGTSVGSKVLTLRQACILATIFETLGAVLMGYKVSDTVRKEIFDVEMFANSEKELLLGNMAALAGSAIWNIVATFFRLPISGTHSIIGSIVGFTLVSRGFYGVHWDAIGKIVASWFLSPVLSGLVSVGIFVGIRHFILKKEKPLEPGLRSLPLFYGFTILINVFSIVHDGPEMLKFNLIPWWGVLILSLGFGFIIGIFVLLYVVPRQRREILALLNPQDGIDNKAIEADGGEIQMNSLNTTTTNETRINICRENGEKHAWNGNVTNMENAEELHANYHNNILVNDNVRQVGGLHTSNSLVPLVVENTDQSSPETSPPSDEKSEKMEDVKTDGDKVEMFKLFSYLQILTAMFGAFAHGGNDVSNAIGPLIAMWIIFMEGNVYQNADTPFYLLLYGGIGISVGLWVWGKKVIKTMGEDLTKITPSSGFTIEIGAASTVLLASKLGLPISTTHCKVGSVVFVGWTRSRDSVDWSLFRNIILAWVLTLPVSGGISAILMAIFDATLV